MFWHERVINPIAVPGRFHHLFDPPEGSYTSFHGMTCHHIVLVHPKISVSDH
jgi:hypothetical protein